MIMARVLTVASGGMEIPFSEVQKREEEQVLTSLGTMNLKYCSFDMLHE